MKDSMMSFIEIFFLVLRLLRVLQIQGVILRNRKYADYSAMFQNEIIGRYPKDIIAELQWITYVQCLLECGRNTKCVAVNFKENNGLCELLGSLSLDDVINDGEYADWRVISTANVEEYEKNKCGEYPYCAGQFQYLCKESSHGRGFDGFAGINCTCFGVVESENLCTTLDGTVKNLARYGNVTMSSIYVSQKHQPEDAINGIYALNKRTFPLNLAHSNTEENPWLQVELEEVSIIHKIRIINRYDNHRGNLNPLTVEYSTDEKEFYDCVQRMNVLAIVDVAVFCDEGLVLAKFIKMKLHQTTFINIQEIEIYGDYSWY